ncbi:glycosyltransferase family 2 protein [Lactobacillus gasseri]|uniref:glycosyltransferase family 2 protein n=1 Tax=Lactobacillus gasseri TaxID=1596 RepID=UPI0030F002FA
MLIAFLNQTYSNIELILIDDGSTDNSPKICEEYRQKYDQVRVLHKKNGGVGSSRNAGVAMASGDYVLFVDNDDWLPETHIEDLYNLLKKNNADIAVGNFNEFDEEKSAFLYWMNENDYFEKCYSPKDWFKLEYRTAYYNMSMVFVVPWGKLYKRDLFKDIVYPIDAKVEDNLTTWKIYLLADKIVYMNKSIYTHRILNASVTAQVDKSSVFPSEAVEQRISLVKSIGFDTTEEEKACEKRSTLLQFDDDYLKSREAKQKLAILKKYREE